MVENFLLFASPNDWALVLNNVFGADACATLLLFKIQDQYWPAMKAFLLFLNILREDELEHIETDVFVCKTLKEL